MKKRAKERELKDKRAISPVIATVLLISVVIVIALILFAWFRSIQKEAIVKENGENIELSCDKLNFNFEYVNGEITVQNTGTIGIYDFRLEEKTGFGSYSTTDLSKELPNWENGLSIGKSISGSLPVNSKVKSLLLIPILIGNTQGGAKKIYVCDERYGKERAVA